jgi:trk system potassium uptake protein TrkA
MISFYFLSHHGQFGRSLLESLLDEGQSGDIVVIDRDEEKIRLIQNRVQNAIILDAANAEILKGFEPETIDTAIVSMGENFQTVLFISALLKELGVKKVIARASTKLEERILQKTGVDLVVFPEVEMGKKVADIIAIPDTFSEFRAPSVSFLRLISS